MGRATQSKGPNRRVPLEGSDTIARRKGHDGIPFPAWRGSDGSAITITYKKLVAEHSRALVYILREPFALVVSFYKYHLSGKECDGHWQRPVCKEIKSKSAADGVRYVGGFVAKNQLPLMQYVHEKLGGHASHSQNSRALGLRMEDWNRDFDKTALGLVSFLAKESKDDVRVIQLATELRGADMNRMQARPSHAAEQNATSAVQDATLRRYLETAKPLCQQLLEYSRALGYSSDVKCSRFNSLRSTRRPPLAREVGEPSPLRVDHVLVPPSRATAVGIRLRRARSPAPRDVRSQYF